MEKGQNIENADKFAKDCLQIHNKYRSKHDCPPLQLNPKLMNYTNGRVKELAKDNKFTIKVDPKQPYGENIFVLQGNINVTPEQVVKTWYDEVTKYNFNDGKFIPQAAHFTQLIWKGSKNFGASVSRKGDITWVVAVYEPPGNYDGEFKENVPSARNLQPTQSLVGTANERDNFAQQCLAAHNDLRKLHGCPPIKLNEKISAYATEWVKHISNVNKMEHRADSLYGECMFMAQGNLIVTGEQVVKAWYAEVSKYNYKEAKFSTTTGHFTQIIWKSTTDLGVGYLRQDTTSWVVCNYDPAGNYPGEFVDNVPALGSKPTPIVNKSPPIDDDTPFETQILIAHNKYRKMHGSPPLVLKQHLSDFSLDWAENLASRNIMEHRPDNKYGENIYLAQGVPHVTGERVVKAWYDEISKYDFNKAQFSHETGHFTQLIWVATKEFGFGKVKKAGTTWVVCNYDPPGNYQGEFRINVPKFGSPAYVDPNANIPFDRQCLIAHNKYRALHGCPPLTLNQKLTDYAAEWVKILSDRNYMEHRPNCIYGENIFMGVGNIVFTGERVTKAWYDEIKLYDFKNPKFAHATGHFTQLIWKNCKQMGVKLLKKDDTTMVVAYYDPPGNFKGEFGSNVPPVLKK